MTFHNEYVPKLEDETSEFLKQFRVSARTGFNLTDAWTVDRERDMALVRTGAGHDIESHTQGYLPTVEGRIASRRH